MSRFLAPWRTAFLASTDAPHDYCELAGLMALSSLMTGRRKVAIGKGVGLNLYALLVGDSSVARKSTSVNLARDLVAAVDGGRIGPKDYTIEGLLKWMQVNKDPETGKSRNKFTIFADEFGSDLAHFATYAKTASADLCGLYDGESFEKVRAGAPTIRIDNPQVSLFGAVAYSMMEASLKENDWRTGFLMRFVFAAPLHMRPPMTLQPQYPQGLWDQVRDSACRLLDDVRQVNGGRVISMTFTPQAAALYQAYSHHLEQEILNLGSGQEHEIGTIYIARFKVSLQKIAALYQIDDDPLLPIGQRAMEQAVGFARAVLWPSFFRAVECTTLDSMEGLVRAIRRRILEAGPSGIHLATLHAQFHRYKHYDVTIRSLRSNDVIRTFRDLEGREVAVWRHTH